MQNIDYYYQIIEKAIARLGLDPNAAKSTESGRWFLTQGSADIIIDIFHNDGDNIIYFQVMSHIMEIPKRSKERFYEELLTINDHLLGIAFSVNGGNVYLSDIRECDGLDVSEALEMIRKVAEAADEYDNKLMDSYPD
ncbi:MAG: YbjN domain-containing protein [Cytophagales bacterium]|nr:YbjN domain-containing protein [Cytophagales bacterium]